MIQTLRSKQAPLCDQRQQQLALIERRYSYLASYRHYQEPIKSDDLRSSQGEKTENFYASAVCVCARCDGIIMHAWIL